MGLVDGVVPSRCAELLGEEHADPLASENSSYRVVERGEMTVGAVPGKPQTRRARQRRLVQASPTRIDSEWQQEGSEFDFQARPLSSTMGSVTAGLGTSGGKGARVKVEGRRKLSERDGSAEGSYSSDHEEDADDTDDGNQHGYDGDDDGDDDEGYDQDDDDNNDDREEDRDDDDGGDDGDDDDGYDDDDADDYVGNGGVDVGGSNGRKDENERTKGGDPNDASTLLMFKVRARVFVGYSRSGDDTPVLGAILEKTKTPFNTEQH